MSATIVDPFGLPCLPGGASSRSAEHVDPAARVGSAARVDSAVPGPARRSSRVVASGGELYALADTRWCALRCDVLVGHVVVSPGAVGLGTDLYTERTVSLTVCGPTQGDAVVAGGVRVATVGGRGLDSVGTLAIDAGAARLFLGRVLVAAACENVTASRVGGSTMESRLGLGVALLLPDTELRCSVATKGLDGPSLAVGCEVRLGEWLRVRSGASVDPGRFAAGLGLGRPGVAGTPAVDLAWQWHPELGGSSVVSIECPW